MKWEFTKSRAGEPVLKDSAGIFGRKNTNISVKTFTSKIKGIKGEQIALVFAFLSKALEYGSRPTEILLSTLSILEETPQPTPSLYQHGNHLLESSKNLDERDLLLAIKAICLISRMEYSPGAKRLLLRLLKTKKSDTAHLFMLNSLYLIQKRTPSFAAIAVSYLMTMINGDSDGNTAQAENRRYAAAHLLYLIYEDKNVPYLQEILQNTLHVFSKKKSEVHEAKRIKHDEEVPMTTSSLEELDHLMRCTKTPFLGRIVALFLDGLLEEDNDKGLGLLIDFVGEAPKKRAFLLSSYLNLFFVTGNHGNLPGLLSRLRNTPKILSAVISKTVTVDEETLLRGIDESEQTPADTISLLTEILQVFRNKPLLGSRLLDFCLENKETRGRASHSAAPLLQRACFKKQAVERCLSAVSENEIEKCSYLLPMLLQHSSDAVSSLARHYIDANMEKRKNIHGFVLRRIKPDFSPCNDFLDAIEGALSSQTITFFLPIMFSFAEGNDRLYTLIKKFICREYGGEAQDPRLLSVVGKEIKQEDLALLLPHIFSYLNGTAGHAASVKETLKTIYGLEQIDSEAILGELRKEKCYNTHEQMVEGISLALELFPKDVLIALLTRIDGGRTISAASLETLRSFLALHPDQRNFANEVFGRLIKKYLFGTERLWAAMISLAKALLPEAIPILLSLRKQDLMKICTTDKNLKRRIAEYLLKQSSYIQGKYSFFMDDWMYG
eukprot:GHVN01063048.1.p1 GENE.GHVN01063048.1~~GHVN01063048.1.p1  ORF type:complete len:725 (+),score=68.43 GHVN01063048.1:40-2214(+)